MLINSLSLTLHRVCLQAHASCYIMIPPECGLGRLRNMILHPSCVRICSRNFSKMHCYRISEPPQQCELGNQPAEMTLINKAIVGRLKACVHDPTRY